jgi:hypothetical protein
MVVAAEIELVELEELFKNPLHVTGKFYCCKKLRAQAHWQAVLHLGPRLGL